MNRKAEKTVSLPNGWTVTVKGEKFLTTLKGGWETADETICGDDTKIIVRDKDGKIIADGGEIIEISSKSPVEVQRDLGSKGCVAYLIGTRFGMREESYQIVKKAIDAVNAETVFPEYIEYLAAKAAEEKKIRVNDAIKTVAAGDKEMENGGYLMTGAEYRAWRKRYNDIHNEGGDGFIPSRITIEEYREAKKIIEGEFNERD